MKLRIYLFSLFLGQILLTPPVAATPSDANTQQANSKGTKNILLMYSGDRTELYTQGTWLVIETNDLKDEQIHGYFYLSSADSLFIQIPQRKGWRKRVPPELPSNSADWTMQTVTVAINEINQLWVGHAHETNNYSIAYGSSGALAGIVVGSIISFYFVYSWYGPEIISNRVAYRSLPLGALAGGGVGAFYGSVLGNMVGVAEHKSAIHYRISEGEWSIH